MDDITRQLAEDTYLEPAAARMRRMRSARMAGNSSRQRDEDTLQEKVAVDARKRRPREGDEVENSYNRKVALPTLRLTTESQRIIMEVLKYIHGPDFELKKAHEYEDVKSNVERTHWVDRGNLVVKGASDNSGKTEEELQKLGHQHFAVNKLAQYHFHEAHCREALQAANDSVDQALEILFSKYYNVDSEECAEDVPSWGELRQMRSDEAEVLESIYEDSFKVKDSSTWSKTLQLDYITELYIGKQTKPKVNVPKRKGKKTVVCRANRNGQACLVKKCPYVHISLAEPSAERKSIQYELEIRFPEGTSYPYQVPLIFFKTTDAAPEIPSETFLKITSRLIEEATSSVQNGVPCVHSIIELLFNEEEILKAIQSDSQFPLPSEFLFAHNSDGTLLEEIHPTHYKKEDPARPPIDMDRIKEENKNIAKLYRSKKRNQKYLKSLENRMLLPAWQKRHEIINTIKSSQVVVISGETGCGKSTQVPQFILDDWLEGYDSGGRDHVEIVCTQPRRISAIGVAGRVAQERAETTGQVVGYQVRLDNKVSSATRLTFCTTGILLRRLQSDPDLTTVTHVLVDEIHERSEDSDFLILILKNLLSMRKDLRVVLMSATLNPGLFAKYFDDAPILEIPGRTFPVKGIFLEEIMELTGYYFDDTRPYCTRYMNDANKDRAMEELAMAFFIDPEERDLPDDAIPDEMLSATQIVARYPYSSKVVCEGLYLMNPAKIDLDLVEEVLFYIVEGSHDWPKEGAILVFLPGIAEIMNLYNHLTATATHRKRNWNNDIILPLHSSLSNEEQAAVFSKPPPGVRKIVLSTNIAETSITIEDCVFVIDCGRMKEKTFNPACNMESLDLVWVSQANAKQRKGRAGRVMEGVCIHLYTSHRYHNMLLHQPVPEIQRTPLEQVVLKVLTLPLFQGKTAHNVLGNIIEPPPSSHIDDALIRLQDLGALDTEFELTPLGRHLAALPVDVRVGKLVLLGAVFRCVDSALTIAAFLSSGSIFSSPMAKRDAADEKHREFACANSDQLTMLQAYRKWQEAMRRSTEAGVRFASDYFLSHKAMVMLAGTKHQLLGYLSAIGFVPDIPELSRTIKKDSVERLTGSELNTNGNNHKILLSILCAALYPNVVKVLSPETVYMPSPSGNVPMPVNPKQLKFKTMCDGCVNIHPSSLLASEGDFSSPYIVYHEKVKTTRVFIRDCSMVPELPLVLFTGCSLGVQRHGDRLILSLDEGWIMFAVENHEIAGLLQAIRIELFNLLEEKNNDPSLNLLNYEKGRRIIDTIVKIINQV